MHLRRQLCISEVDALATGEEAEVVKERKDLTARLVHRGDDGAAAIDCELPQRLHDREGGSTVETAGGFVQEEEARAGEDLQRDAQALLLTATDAAEVPGSYVVVGALPEPHLVQRVVHDAAHLRLAHARRQP